MKNKIKFLGIIALAAVVWFSIAACGNGTTGGGGNHPSPDPTKITFTSWSGSVKYELTVYKEGSRAVYNPQRGDEYELTITDGATVIKGAGKVDEVLASGEFTLRQNGKSGTFKIVTSSSDITEITSDTGKIPVNDGEEQETPPPYSFTSKKHVEETIWLLVNRWTDGDANGQDMYKDMELSYFTNYRPKPGDTLTFRIRGNADKELKNVSMSLSQYVEKPYFYKWLGSNGDYINIGNSFNNEVFEITMANEAKPKVDIIVGLINTLLYKDSGYEMDSGERFPENMANYTEFVKIDNFFIELVDVKKAE
jgi:hypothetical protein